MRTCSTLLPFVSIVEQNQAERPSPRLVVRTSHSPARPNHVGGGGHPIILGSGGLRRHRPIRGTQNDVHHDLTRIDSLAWIAMRRPHYLHLYGTHTYIVIAIAGAQGRTPAPPPDRVRQQALWYVVLLLSWSFSSRQSYFSSAPNPRISRT
jgi:hypothetical protein